MPQPENKDKKLILKRAKNGRRRESHVGAACYGKEKEKIKRAARDYARKMGFRDMSVSAYINMRLLLP